MMFLKILAASVILSILTTAIYCMWVDIENIDVSEDYE